MSDINSSGPGANFDEEPTRFGNTEPLSKGQRLAGIYVLDRYLGHGGMGEVWLADEMRPDTGGREQLLRKVVVKLVPRDIQRVEEEMERVINSFKTVHKLHHEHICPVHAMEVDRQYGHFLVMKYVDGKDLAGYHRDYVKQHGRMPLERLLALLFPAADALDYAHRKKVIHRDIKPRNIMVDKKDGVQIIDFGLADQIRTSMSHVSRVRMGTSGTPHYMAPEQWDGTQQDAQTDQFAFAVMIYYFLTGRFPFPGDGDVLRIQVHKNDVPPLENYPDSVHAVFSKALAKKREDRYASCREFLTALKNAAKQPPPPELSTSSGGKAPIVTGILFIGFLFIVFAAFAGPLLFTHKPKPENNPAVATVDPAPIPLPKPTLGNVTATDNNMIVVSWNAVPNANAYKVEYATTNTFADKKTVTSTERSTMLTDLTANTTYHIRVIATGEGAYNDSVPSDAKTTTTQKIALTKPTLGNVTATNSSTINVPWNAVPNASGYKVEYATTYTFADKKTATSTGTSTTLTGLTASTTYHIRVTAIGTGVYVDSVSSDAKTATTETAAPKITLAEAIKIDDMETIREWIEYDPTGTSKTLFDHALSQHNGRKYDDAEKYYKLAIEANPENAYAHCGYAILAEDHKQDYGSAEKHYKLAIEADPKYPKAHNDYALFLADYKQEYDSAEKYHKLAIEADPKNSMAHNNYAVLLENHKQDYEGAEKHYKLAIDADPKNLKAHNNYANLLMNHNQDYDSAEKHYKLAIEFDPKNYAHNNYAILLENHKQDYEGAEKHYKLAIDADPKNSAAHNNYAVLLENHKQDYEDAEKHYKLAIEADPKYAKALYNYADFLEYKRKDIVRAKEYYKRATEAEPDNKKYADKYREISGN